MQQNLQRALPAPFISKETEAFLEKFAKELQIPDSRYEEAEKRYVSVGDWLCREQSSLRSLNPSVHIQGSFGLATVIRPLSEDEDYDIDMVAEFIVDISKMTQKDLKSLVIKEMELYAKNYSMEKPESHRRCVRLNYAEEAQFHMDVTPAVPNGQVRKRLLTERGIKNDWIELSVAITDEKHPAYSSLSLKWNNSNPRGYLQWFHSRMATVFEQRRQAIALVERKAVEKIPAYRVMTPLQSAIQILKRHRDMTHEGDPDDRPISIIITTLSALAYNGETTIGSSLYGILGRMDSFIQRNGLTTTIPNPTDPEENFADKWKEKPERQQAFYDWLERAKADFHSILELRDIGQIGSLMSPVLGSRLVEKAVNATNANKVGIIAKYWSLNNPTHKQPPKWPQSTQGRVKIANAEYKPKMGGFRWRSFQSGGGALPKNCDLRFEAETNITAPYEVYWQVVNTGEEAERRGGLRGGFDVGEIDQGKLKRNESTSYRGTHTIECFIIKNSYCVASSGPFLVNIK